MRFGRNALVGRCFAPAGSPERPALRADTHPPMGPSNRRMIARTRLGSSRSPPLACHPPPVLGLTLTRGMATSIRVMRTSVGVSVVAANDRDALPTAVSQGVVRDGQAHYSEAARRRSDRRIAGQ